MSLTKLAIIVLAVIAGLALLIGLFLLWKVFDLQKMYEHYVIHTASSNSCQQIEPLSLGNAIKNSNSAKRYIKDLVDEEVSNIMHHPSKGLIEDISDAVYEDICHLFQLNSKEIAEMQKEETRQKMPSSSTVSVVQEQANQRENVKVYYASALNEEDNRTFYNVADQPVTGETIFRFIELNYGKCEFDIYEGAYSKVLRESAFLTGACRLTKIGSSKVVVNEKGIAELTPDNKWVVTKPAKVKFE